MHLQERWQTRAGGGLWPWSRPLAQLEMELEMQGFLAQAARAQYRRAILAAWLLVHGLSFFHTTTRASRKSTDLASNN